VTPAGPSLVTLGGSDRPERRTRRVKTYALTFLLTTTAPEREVERLAAELGDDARAHLKDGERLGLAGIEFAPD
jgi:hypothetical protein